jgi:NAD(P)-dependent dehydrogenase (short-subunit alcohol dehydrogenase family)
MSEYGMGERRRIAVPVSALSKPRLCRKEPSVNSLKGQVVAITGGGRGIGKAIATAAAVAGARVVIGDIDEPSATEAANEIGHGALARRLDVTNRASFADFVTTAAELGSLDVLVNNAGIMPTGAFENESDDLTDRQVYINLRGVLLGCKLAVERMLEQGHGHILNTASVAGFVSAPGVATYTATKHAVVGLTEALRLEYKSRGIRFTTLLPSAVQTELVSGIVAPKGFAPIAPSAVGVAVVKAIARPRAMVFVPGYMEGICRATKLLPSVVTDRLLELTGGSRGVLDADPQLRASYNARIRD